MQTRSNQAHELSVKSTDVCMRHTKKLLVVLTFSELMFLIVSRNFNLKDLIANKISSQSR